MLLHRRINRRSFLALAALGIAAACRPGGNDDDDVADGASPSSTEMAEVETPMTAATSTPASQGLGSQQYFSEVRTNEEGVRHLIPLDDVEWGGVSKDGIPSIDRPHFVGPDRWDDMVYDPERLVIGVEVDGNHRAYPLQILIWHEIVNDTFQDQPLLVTY